MNDTISIETNISDNLPYTIPDSWEIVCLNDIGIYRKGPFGSSLTKSMFVSKGTDTVKVYEQKNAIKKDHTLGDYYITRKYYDEKMKSFTVSPGDIIVSCAGTIGETYIMPNDIELGIINQALMRMTIFAPIDIDYFLIYFDYVLKSFAKENSKGSAIKNIPPFEIFKQLLFPLPPLAEQKRIVAKIEELLPYIEEYDKAETELSALNEKFPEMLKKSILQEAVQGKLVPQDPNDEPASVLLERIKAEKQRLIKEGKIKKDKQKSPAITSAKIPYTIPESWVWCRLGFISTYNQAKQKINAKNADKSIWLLDLEDIEKGGRLLVKKTVGDKKAIGDKTLFNKGDILYSKLRPYLLKILIASGNGICTPEIVPFTVYSDISAEYIVNFLKSPYVDGFINGETYGIKMPRAGTETMINLPVPLPPVEEQKRIVRKIDEIMQIINKL